MRLFERERDLRFDILAAHGKAGAAASATPATEQTFEEITESASPTVAAKHIAKVTLLAPLPSPAAA